jgi:hypothetical protein
MELKSCFYNFCDVFQSIKKNHGLGLQLTNAVMTTYQSYSHIRQSSILSVLCIGLKFRL